MDEDGYGRSLIVEDCYEWLGMAESGCEWLWMVDDVCG
jgi:hypothetical protein